MGKYFLGEQFDCSRPDAIMLSRANCRSLAAAPAKLDRRTCLGLLSTMGALAVLSGCSSGGGAAAAATFGTGATAGGGAGGGSTGTGTPPAATFTPEQYGAVGDGITNDSQAFTSLSNAVNAAGGGLVILRAVTYVVGRHESDPTGAYAFAPAVIMTFEGCTKDVTIEGNGACLRCQDGLRFGTFDPATGLPTSNAMPYTGTGELASPYRGMIIAQNCSGKVVIKDLELDGNIQRLSIGGQYGDTGWQIPAYGIQLINNAGGELVQNVHLHHQPVDGILIDAPVARATETELVSVVSEYNVRQGCSVNGGSNFSFSSCKFNHSGKAGMTSAPGAGVDIEAETSPIRNLKFSGCEFADNTGAGLVADSGDSANATFDNCRFVGTTNWAAWPRKPSFKFTNCVFVGSICCTYGDTDLTKAAQFVACSFYDDPALSPTGQVYNASFPIADLSNYANVLFDTCTFKLTNDEVLPWSTSVIYKDVVMSQAVAKQAYPRGTYLGSSKIDGNVDLTGSTIKGDVTVNGVLLQRTA